MSVLRLKLERRDCYLYGGVLIREGGRIGGVYGRCSVSFGFRLSSGRSEVRVVFVGGAVCYVFGAGSGVRSEFARTFD